MVSSNALRSAATRSAGTPGGTKNGRPMSSRAITSRSAACSGSVLARSSAFVTPGSSAFGRSAHCAITLIFLSARHCEPRRAPSRHAGPGRDRALHLAALECEVDLGRALVTGDDLELGAEQRVRDQREVDLRGARRLRAHDQLLALDLVEALHRRGMP